ncbi:hypothetical protein, partial [Bacteroides sp.]|uniref:hypothetical protein n=1 Tax=Bacteroides sp. TaxID=29523 RepID=UPI00258D5955
RGQNRLVLGGSLHWIFHLPWIEFFRKGNRQSQSCQCRHSAASEAQKSSSPLVSVFFLFSLARLFLPPLDAEKIIPEVANRPNRGK